MEPAQNELKVCFTQVIVRVVMVSYTWGGGRRVQYMSRYGGGGMCYPILRTEKVLSLVSSTCTARMEYSTLLSFLIAEML